MLNKATGLTEGTIEGLLAFRCRRAILNSARFILSFPSQAGLDRLSLSVFINCRDLLTNFILHAVFSQRDEGASKKKNEFLK